MAESFIKHPVASDTIPENFECHFESHSIFRRTNLSFTTSGTTFTVPGVASFLDTISKRSTNTQKYIGAIYIRSLSITNIPSETRQVQMLPFLTSYNCRTPLTYGISNGSVSFWNMYSQLFGMTENDLKLVDYVTFYNKSTETVSMTYDVCISVVYYMS